MDVREVPVRSILTRASGYLSDVVSHSLQPYRGCSFGRSLCGVACYVQHNPFVSRGRSWGSFLEVRVNAAERYRAERERERRHARRRAPDGRFSIFLSSATDPFVPHEWRHRVTRDLLDAMVEAPPDQLIVQTHNARVVEYAARLRRLAGLCDLRVHVSIESDRDRLPGLPRPASPVAARIAALATLRAHGLATVATLSPLHPIAEPERFLDTLAACSDAIVVDHFIGGDGSADGARTRRTRLPGAMAEIDPATLGLDYRDRIVALARERAPGRVGVGPDGFAGRYLPARGDAPSRRAHAPPPPPRFGLKPGPEPRR